MVSDTMVSNRDQVVEEEDYSDQEEVSYIMVIYIICKISF